MSTTITDKESATAQNKPSVISVYMLLLSVALVHLKVSSQGSERWIGKVYSLQDSHSAKEVADSTFRILSNIDRTLLFMALAQIVMSVFLWKSIQGKAPVVRAMLVASALVATISIFILQ